MKEKIIYVVEALYQPPGERHEYRMNDGSAAVELPQLPRVLRWKFYDNYGRLIVKRSVKAAMKAVVEQHKKRFNCK
ncbi:hypothetical protein ACVSUC_19890 [Yersinia enterocolitica]